MEKSVIIPLFARGISAVGSASPWHGGGRGFESLMLHTLVSGVLRNFGFRRFLFV